MNSLQPPIHAAKLPMNNEMIEVASDKIKVRSDQNPKYKKIELSLTNWVGRTALIICTAGLARFILNIVFHSALKAGDINVATIAVKLGASDYLKRSDLVALKEKDKTDSLNFLKSQIIFNINYSYGGSQAAFEFIGARDFSGRYNKKERSNQDEQRLEYQDPVFSKILDNKTMPKVYFYAKTKEHNYAEGQVRYTTKYHHSFKKPGLDSFLKEIDTYPKPFTIIN